MLRAIQDSLLSIVYPLECSVCRDQVEGYGDGAACRNCWDATRIFDGSEMLCDRCGAFFGDKAAPVPVFCHQCNDHQYEKAAALGVYEKALSASIISLKTEPALPARLIKLIPIAIKRTGFDNADIIIPIPLSPQRKLERGYNQADFIAALIGRAMKVPVDTGSLTRTIHTPIHRIAMDKKARELTVRNAFEVKRPKLVDGKNILLVDDVFTSGATASNCARVLKKSGAGKVNIFTLARAVMS
ncbi:MAG: ComF family protein [Pyrinomonadaceae bacterium]